MKVFFLDLLQDLRQKRMLPVAILLVALIAAVPLVVAKPAETPVPSADVPSAPAQPKSALSVASADQPVTASSLRAFSKEDPFKPLDTPRKQPEIGASANPLDAGSGTPATSEAPSSGSGGSGTSPGGSGGGGGGSDGGSGDKDTTTTTTTAYTYTIDVTYKHGDRTRKVKGMEKLGVLPSAENPLFIFMGASAGGDSAVFLIDASLKAVGEGACRPSSAECAFLYLGAGSEHHFTDDDGDTYTLRIDQINKVKVERTTKADSSTKKAAGSIERGARKRRFVAPLLEDLVTVSTTAARRSSKKNGRR